MNIHMGRTVERQEGTGNEIDVGTMKRYIAYCKACVFCLLSRRAALTSLLLQEMCSAYLSGGRRLAREPLRRAAQAGTPDGARQRRAERDPHHRPVRPRSLSPAGSADKCCRQLEAITRISEALAKITLSPTVQAHHVEEAMRLFKVSTMDAASAGSVEGLSRADLNEEMGRIEKELKRRLPVGWSTSYQSLVREFVTQQGYSSHALDRTLFVLEKREVVRFSGQKKVVHRYVSALAFPGETLSDLLCLHSVGV